MMTFKQWLKHREQSPQPTQQPVPTSQKGGTSDQLKLETYHSRKRPAG
ncbi:hypothetical protein MCEMIEM12_00351 [Burkholderiaceae bacterium]